MGLRTIAVHSEADAGALHVRMADEAHAIGPAAARESYLDIDRLVAVIRQTGAQCVHPGYGFLSENAGFAEAVAAAGAVFVGPSPAAIRAMGMKDEAKSIVQKAGVPVVPGYHGTRQDPDFLKEKAYETGYPVLIKAVAGGGGKGMRRVDKQTEFPDALAAAKREAMAAFGDERVLIERYVTAPRHVEIQVFGDTHGNAVHLFERDCSLQRRHQKVIEEAPAPDMPADVRAAMGAAAVAAARAVGYVGAGTVEFIADGSRGLTPGGFFFMEMNTRLQVEHPVTEAITGLDLVELQLHVAAGEKLPFDQDHLGIQGHAVEARLYAEDPESGFLPSTGRLHALGLPEGEGVRVDTGVEEGDEVTPFYDPMIAKVIARGATRDEALDRLSAALGDTLVAGPRTNLAFLKALADNADFRAGRFDTGFIDRNLAALGAVKRDAGPEVIAAAARALLEREERRLAAACAARSDEVFSPWAVNDGFRLGPPPRRTLALVANGEQQAVTVRFGRSGPDLDGAGDRDAIIVEAGDAVLAIARGRQTAVRFADPFDVDLDAGDGEAVVRAPLNGKVVAVLVEAGQTVARGERVALLEAMKMEHALLAPRGGVVQEVRAAAGDQVPEGARLIVIGEEDADAGTPLPTD